MKNTLMWAIALGALTSLSACKKNYTCNCTKTYTGSSVSVSIKDGTYTYNDTKLKATDRCKANENSGSDLGGNYSVNCSIQ